MRNIPESYRMGRKIALKTVLSEIKKPADKKKLKSCLKSVCLTHQIQGETIPSFVDDRYRYEVIQFLKIQLDTVKKAESAATVLHKLFKPPCIIQFHDNVQGAISFADKRLSRQDDQKIVLEEQVVTPVQLLFFSTVKDGELDIDALKQELGEFTEAGPEKYEFTWAGKQQARQIAFEPIVGKTLTFVPEDSKHPDTTENLFIEGDNLEVLKLLRQNYYGAVKVILIDPPYNKDGDFLYNDNFRMSQRESEIAQQEMSDLGPTQN